MSMSKDPHIHIYIYIQTKDLVVVVGLPRGCPQEITKLQVQYNTIQYFVAWPIVFKPLLCLVNFKQRFSNL